MLMVLPDPEKVTSNAPQTLPHQGVTVPCPVDETPFSEKEWKALIKAGAPVLLADDKEKDGEG